jgi:hypothetical protein
VYRPNVSTGEEIGLSTIRKKTADVFAAIETALRPYVGATMASTAAVAQAQRLGLDGAALDETQVALLLQKLTLGLVIFLGETKTKSVVGLMRQAIDELEEAR